MADASAQEDIGSDSSNNDVINNPSSSRTTHITNDDDVERKKRIRKSNDEGSLGPNVDNYGFISSSIYSSSSIVCTASKKKNRNIDNSHHRNNDDKGNNNIDVSGIGVNGEISLENSLKQSVITSMKKITMKKNGDSTNSRSLTEVTYEQLPNTNGDEERRTQIQLCPGLSSRNYDDHHNRFKNLRPFSHSNPPFQHENKKIIDQGGEGPRATHKSLTPTTPIPTTNTSTPENPFEQEKVLALEKMETNHVKSRTDDDKNTINKENNKWRWMENSIATRTSESRRSWHQELLFSLFLRCDEGELCSLKDKCCLPDNQGGFKSRGRNLGESIKSIDDKNGTSNQRYVDRTSISVIDGEIFRTNRRKRSRVDGGGVGDCLLTLPSASFEDEATQSVLTVLTHLLRNLNQNDSHDETMKNMFSPQSNNENQCEERLKENNLNHKQSPIKSNSFYFGMNIPKRYKRLNHVAQTRHESEDTVMSAFKERVLSNSTPQTEKKVTKNIHSRLNRNGYHKSGDCADLSGGHDDHNWGQEKQGDGSDTSYNDASDRSVMRLRRRSISRSKAGTCYDDDDDNENDEEKHPKHSIDFPINGHRSSRDTSSSESISIKNKKDHLKTLNPVPSSSSYEPYTILYNECSLSAIATWASRPQLLPKINKSSSSPSSASKKIISTFRDIEKQNTMNSNMFFRPVAPPLFRKCSICGFFGHYEVECQKIERKRHQLGDKFVFSLDKHDSNKTNGKHEVNNGENSCGASRCYNSHSCNSINAFANCGGRDCAVWKKLAFETRIQKTLRGFVLEENGFSPSIVGNSTGDIIKRVGVSTSSSSMQVNSIFGHGESSMNTKGGCASKKRRAEDIDTYPWIEMPPGASQPQLRSIPQSQFDDVLNSPPHGNGDTCLNSSFSPPLPLTVETYRDKKYGNLSQQLESLSVDHNESDSVIANAPTQNRSRNMYFHQNTATQPDASVQSPYRIHHPLVLQNRKEKEDRQLLIKSQSKRPNMSESIQTDAVTTKIPIEHHQKEEEEYFTKSTACQICGSGFRGEDLLLCDGCDGLFHRQCLNPPLSTVPDGDWFCELCDAYDSDVSSVVEIEALDGFVIEQRKRGDGEECGWARERNMRVGFSGGGGDDDANDGDDFENSGGNGFQASVCVIKRDEDSAVSTSGRGRDQENIADINSLKDNDRNNSGMENSVTASWETSSMATESNNSGTTRMFTFSEFELAPGELCWAKRRDAPQGMLGRDDFWPALVIQVSDTRHRLKVDGSRPTPYVVKMFALQGAGRVRASDVLSFFPHYEEIGHQRLMFGRGEPGYEEFRKALDESTAEIGCSNLGQALKKAREITLGDDDVGGGTYVKATANGDETETRVHEKKAGRKKANKNNSENSAQSEKISRPIEWDIAEIDEEDGITILSRNNNLVSPFSDDENLLGKKKSIVSHNDWGENKGTNTSHASRMSSGQASGIASPQRPAQLLPDTETLPSMEKVIGGIVAFPVKQLSNSNCVVSRELDSASAHRRKEKLHLGVAVGCNRLHEKILVRCISDLDDIASSLGTAKVQALLNEDVEEDDVTTDMYSCNLGASLWIPMKSLMHVSNCASSDLRNTCRTTLNFSLKAVRDKIKAKRNEEATQREENMIELVTLQDEPDSEPVAPSTPAVASRSSSESNSTPSHSNSKLETPKALTSSTASISKPTYTSKVNNGSTIKPTPSSMSPVTRNRDGEIFVAEKILEERRLNTGTKEYLIKWKGFGEEESTWEPEKNILNSDFLRIYAAEKLAEELKQTKEADDSSSYTSCAIRMLEYGLMQLSDDSKYSSRPKIVDKKKRCPFCLTVLKDGSAFGGHVKLHSKEVNYRLIKDVVKICDESWYKAYHI